MSDSSETGESFMSALFEAGGCLLALDSGRVEEIVRVPEITPVRGASPYVLGIANLRGRIVTVIDVAARLGLGAAEAGEGARVLVAESGGESVGLLVERLHDVVEAPRSSLRPLAGSIGAAAGAGRGADGFFLGAFDAGGRTAALVDPERVLAAE